VGRLWRAKGRVPRGFGTHLNCRRLKFSRRLEEEYRPEREFFVTYDPDQLTGHGIEETIPRPEGISGCAVFTVPTGEDGGVWTPSITRVIGIVTHHFPRLRLLRVKRFDVWAGIIRRHCENRRR